MAPRPSGHHFVEGLRVAFAPESDAALAKRLQVPQPIISNSRKRRVTRTIAKNFSKKVHALSARECSGYFLDSLRSSLGCASDSDLARKLGFTPANISQFRKSALTSARIKKFISAYRKASVSSASSRLVEFYPISARSGEGHPLDKKNVNDRALAELLRTRRGVYAFYDSMGRLIYVGKAKRTYLYGEIGSAFNRSMSDHVVYKVSYPIRKKRPLDFLNVKRPIKRTKMLVRDTASYMTVYALAPELIDHMEAMLIRFAPNEIINVKMEQNVLK